MSWGFQYFILDSTLPYWPQKKRISIEIERSFGDENGIFYNDPCLYGAFLFIIISLDMFRIWYSLWSGNLVYFPSSSIICEPHFFHFVRLCEILKWLISCKNAIFLNSCAKCVSLSTGLPFSHISPPFFIHNHSADQNGGVKFYSRFCHFYCKFCNEPVISGC